jgi:tetratricopeptide (TPR) repeat protein
MENVNTVKQEKTRSLADFLQQKRILFTGLMVSIIAAVAVFFIAAGVLDADTKKKLTVLESLVERYEKVAYRIGIEIEDEVAGTDIETLLADLESFAESARGYAGSKAWSLVGMIYAEQKKWADAENAFSQSAEKGIKTHLYGPSLFNAGAAAEEGGHIEKAIEYYTRCAAVPGTIIGARARFSVGRLQEATGDREAALLTYRNVIAQYTDSSGDTWRDFAQSRLIALDENN